MWQYDNKLSASTQWNVGVQMTLPFSAALDVAYTGQHSYDTNAGVNLNAIDLGAAFLPAYQNPALATSASSTDPATSYASSNPDLVRFYRGYAAINQQQPIGWRTYHSIQIALNRRFRNGLLFGFNDTIGLSDKQNAALRLQHNADGTITVRADQAKADELLGDNHPQAHLMRAHFVWNLPRVTALGYGAARRRRDRQRLEPVRHLVGRVGHGLQRQRHLPERRRQREPHRLAGLRPARAASSAIPARGCSGDPLRQFNTGAFRGPLVGSDGLESGNGYLTGCFISSLDLAIARTIKLGGNRNAPVAGRRVQHRSTRRASSRGRRTMNLTSPSDPATITNLPFDAAGNVIPSRARPNGAGFGVATDYQPPRSVQLQARFSF